MSHFKVAIFCVFKQFKNHLGQLVEGLRLLVANFCGIDVVQSGIFFTPHICQRRPGAFLYLFN